MRPDVNVKLPDHGSVGNALIEILRTRQNRTLKASEACEMLAEHFKLDWKQLNVKVATRDERKWHNVCRTARNHLVKKGILHRLPRDSWKLTDDEELGF
jgi:restriction endonuclease Mrr